MGVFGEKLLQSSDNREVGFIFLGYFIFGIFMTVAATAMSRILFFILCFVVLLFGSQFLGTFGIWPKFSNLLAGISELLISILSFYASAASVLNATFGKIVLPVGKPFSVFNEAN